MGNGVGMGLKLFGIPGPKLLEDEPDSGTFDYALINNPVFFANTVEHYLFIQQLFLQVGGAPPADKTPEQARAGFHRFLYNFLTGMGNLSVVDIKVAADGSLLYLRRRAWVKDKDFKPGTGALYRVHLGIIGKPLP